MVDPIITAGILYANVVTLLSIGFTLMYMTASVPNFAHGAQALIGAYISLTAYLNGHNPYLYMPIAFLIGGGFSFFLYKIIIGELRARGATLISLTVSTLAVNLVISSFIGIYVDYIWDIRKFPADAFSLLNYDFNFFDLRGILIFSTIMAATLILSLHLLLTKTEFGISMRASVENSQLAEVLGVDVEWVLAISWFLTGGLNGLAGSMLPLFFTVHMSDGAALTTTIFAAGTLGGLKSVYGAIVGGYIVGFTEIFFTNILVIIFGSWITSYRPLIPLVVMVIVLLTQPSGIIDLLYKINVKIKKREN